MSLDDQLAELLSQLGVILEDPRERPAAQSDLTADDADSIDDLDDDRIAQTIRASLAEEAALTDELAAELDGPPDVSLFQTSREHYGVFYRLDLVGGLPQLRIFMPDDSGLLRMRCYLVRAAAETPLSEWFLSTQAHRGSPAYDDVRESAQQHLLFAAGELMKRLFWNGELELMRFPAEIAVLRLA
jgi:hypothetical protein